MSFSSKSPVDERWERRGKPKWRSTYLSSVDVRSYSAMMEEVDGRRYEGSVVTANNVKKKRGGQNGEPPNRALRRNHVAATVSRIKSIIHW